MNRPATHASLRMMSAVVVAIALAPGGCSTDRSGLGELDAGGSSGGRAGIASGGNLGSGGAPGTGGAGTGGTATGGSTAGETGGTVGTSSGGTAGTDSGGATAAGGAATGGRGGGGGRFGLGGASSGGAASGGRAGTGGAATGGAATGGRGTGGAGSGGAAATPKPECTRASDCHLQSDCCTCTAVGPNQPTPPLCAQVCIQSRCAALQLSQNAVACVAGRCVAGFDCDASEVTCRMAAPDCPAGQVPSVSATRNCYSGSCVPATQCAFVTNCNDCGPTDACVTNQVRGGNERHCVTIPPACNGATTCGCLGETTCVSPYTSCDTSGNGLTCGCPTC